MHKRTKDVVLEVAKKHGLPPHVVEKIAETPWRLMRKTIEETPDKLDMTADDFPVFYHKHLGVFQANDRRLNRIRKNRKKDA